jgi:hypothetical protein
LHKKKCPVWWCSTSAHTAPPCFKRIM